MASVNITRRGSEDWTKKQQQQRQHNHTTQQSATKVAVSSTQTKSLLGYQIDSKDIANNLSI